jgi:hypothetical protein
MGSGVLPSFLSFPDFTRFVPHKKLDISRDNTLKGTKGTKGTIKRCFNIKGHI